MPHRALARICALAALALPAPRVAMAQPPAADGAPPGAYSVGGTFDLSRGVLVLFGGFARGRYLGDTWEWNGARWSRDSVAPPARNAPALVYDGARRRLLMFGGDTRDRGSIRETWARDPSGWRLVDSTGPSGRAAPLVFDSRRGRVVLFGGAGGGQVHGDTWELGDGGWRLVAGTGPPARGMHAMAYDSARGRVVAFGGTPRLASDATPLDDTWEFDGATWRRVDARGPGARDHAMMAYDPVRRAVVLHGGGDGPASGETWAFDGTRWTKLSEEGPRRRGGVLVWDARRGRLLLYGGFDAQPSNELWEFRDRWRRVSP